MNIFAYYLHAHPPLDRHSRVNNFSYENVFNQFVKTMGNTNLTVMLNGKKRKDIDEFPENINFSSIYFESPSEEFMSSYIYAFSFVCNTILKDIESGKMRLEDLIYLVEDDYWHLDNWPENIIGLYEQYPQLLNNGILSLYDHPDKYGLYKVHNYDDVINGKYRILVAKNRHWREVPNICGNFICSAYVFKKYYEKIVSTHPDNLRSAVLVENGVEFFTPIPTLSSHMSVGLMSPAIDWDTYV